VQAIDKCRLLDIGERWIENDQFGAVHEGPVYSESKALGMIGSVAFRFESPAAGKCESSIIIPRDDEYRRGVCVHFRYTLPPRNSCVNTSNDAARKGADNSSGNAIIGPHRSLLSGRKAYQIPSPVNGFTWFAFAEVGSDDLETGSSSGRTAAESDDAPFVL